jgi:hypothetical protein
MGGLATDTIDRLVGHDLIPVEVRDRHLWDEVWCKGECRQMMLVLRVPARGIVEGLMGAVIHERSLAFHRFSCLLCGMEWLTNTKPTGSKGAWDDTNDPSLKRAFKNPPMRALEKISFKA